MNNHRVVIDIRKTIDKKSNRFNDRFRLFIRAKGLSYGTEKTYCHWINRFIKSMGYKFESEMVPLHINDFLSDLGNERNCSINTQRTALNGLVFLFREFLKVKVGEPQFQNASKPRKIPIVLSRSEARSILDQLTGRKQLIVKILFGNTYSLLIVTQLIPEAV